VLSLILCGCAGSLEGSRQAVATPPGAGACGGSLPLPEDLLQPGGLVLFGEIHGVQELPVAFGDAVCAAASSGAPVEVGLEAPQGEHANLDRFLASQGTPADRAALLATPFWSSAYQDGRRSRARADLLDRLRRMRGAGLPIGVFLFDIDAGEDASARDRAMAETIAAHARAHPGAVTLVLVGEVHAWKTQGSPWDPGFLPMGWHLVKAGLRVRSLGRATPNGTAWVCTSSSPDDCSTIGTKATESLPSGSTSGVELLPTPSARGYDGLYGTTTLTASPPAVQP
jgi:hypothetical protein